MSLWGLSFCLPYHVTRRLEEGEGMRSLGHIPFLHPTSLLFSVSYRLQKTWTTQSSLSPNEGIMFSWARIVYFETFLMTCCCCTLCPILSWIQSPKSFLLLEITYVHTPLELMCPNEHCFLQNSSLGKNKHLLQQCFHRPSYFCNWNSLWVNQRNRLIGGSHIIFHNQNQLCAVGTSIRLSELPRESGNHWPEAELK